MSVPENSFRTCKDCMVCTESNTHVAKYSCVQDNRFVAEMSNIYCHGNGNTKYIDDFRPSTYTFTQKHDQLMTLFEEYVRTTNDSTNDIRASFVTKFQEWCLATNKKHIKVTKRHINALINRQHISISSKVYLTMTDFMNDQIKKNQQ